MREDIDFVDTLHAQKNSRLNKNIVIFFFMIILFFITAFFWSYYSEVDELTRGEGKVIPSEKIKTIQSLDGGIISEILVKEGTIVKKGQALMKIDTTRFKASLDESKKTYQHLLVTRIRLKAESEININKAIPSLEYPVDLRLNVPQFIQSDKQLFNSRYNELTSTSNILQSQLKQKQQELAELHAKEEQLSRRHVLVSEEASTIKQLVEKGSRSKIDLIKLKKELNKIEGDIQVTKLQIPKAKYSIDEVHSKILEKERIFKAEAFNELQKVNTEIKKFESKMIAEKDKLEKTILVSPVDGIIKQIYMNTIGGVIRSGLDLIEIVPDSDILLVEAKIDPKDIAFINPRQNVIVKFTAYDFSIYGALEGKVVEISADSIVDEKDRDNKSYYKVTIQTDKNYLEREGEKLPIIPGMITNVDIITGKKSILNYILKPILKTKDNALRER